MMTILTLFLQLLSISVHGSIGHDKISRIMNG